MAIPSDKSNDIARFLEELAGRTTAIHSDECIKPPFGCGGPAIDFVDDISRKEYAISGLCQKCQNELFKEDDDAL